MGGFMAVISGAFLLAVGIAVLVAILKSFLYIGKPSEVLIFSGRDYTLPSGETVGYRYAIGGRTLMIPVLETVERMDLRVIPVNIRIDGAYSKGGIPLNVHAIANVKVSSNPREIHNAIERFLGRDRSEISRVAQETLEGNLRGILATLTPEQINEDRISFVDEIAKEAGPDLSKLGLHLDTLKIQNVSDNVEYLDSIGRKRIAEIIKQAEVAESDAMKAAEEIEAEEQGRAEVARREAQAEIQRSQNELRQLQADLELKAKSEEEKAQARALAARAEAEQELQHVRTELEELRLKADVVIPAEAEKVAREMIAVGEAAEIAEKGRAMAEVLQLMTEVWLEAGDAALDVFIIHRLEEVMDRVSEAARQVQVREVALIDSGDGAALPNYVSAFPGIVSNLFRDLRDTVGIDIGGALTGERMRMLGAEGEDPETAALRQQARQELAAKMRAERERLASERAGQAALEAQRAQRSLGADAPAAAPAAAPVAQAGVLRPRRAAPAAEETQKTAPISDDDLFGPSAGAPGSRPSFASLQRRMNQGDGEGS